MIKYLAPGCHSVNLSYGNFGIFGDMSMLFLIACTIFSLLLVAFFTGVEMAFINSSRIHIELRKKQGSKQAAIISGYHDKPHILFGITIVGINLGIVLYGIFFIDWMRTTLWNPFQIQNPYFKLAFDTVFSSAILLLAGLFLPRALYKAKPDRFIVSMAIVIRFFESIFYPVIQAITGMADFILKYLFNVPLKKTENDLEGIDLETFILQSKEQEENNDVLHADLFENALALPTIKVRQCLVPRTEIEGIPITATIEQARNFFIETKLSKGIVYKENIDDIQGYIHQLDLFKKPESIATILHTVPVIPETMNATDLLNIFSKDRKSIAWVVDEFGGTAGIVTMEDVLEEVFGDIKDEYDTEDLQEKQLAENEYIFSGRLELDYLNDKYGIGFEKKDAETLSGFIIEENKAIPEAKKRIILDKYEFDILSVSDTRIESVRVKKLSD